MESQQQQITVVSTKLDALQKMVEDLNVKLTALLLEHSSADKAAAIAQANGGRSSLLSSPELSHKDVLVDVNFVDMEEHGGEQVLSPEIQIQRLTAQLTAAYNRIAVLEEQLLARRSH